MSGDAWTQKLTETEAGINSHVASLGAAMLKVVTADSCALVGYGFIRRVELQDNTLLIYASECIIQVVGTELDALLEPLQNHQLSQIAIGQHGVTHIEFLATE